ncbi:ergosterol biosynthesis ERG4/ERG24 family-domain-containing protein [Aspergillus filifer]
MLYRLYIYGLTCVDRGRAPALLHLPETIYILIRQQHSCWPRLRPEYLLRFDSRLIYLTLRRPRTFFLTSAACSLSFDGGLVDSIYLWLLCVRLMEAQHWMTGNHVYDFFMGAKLNPRLFQWIDMMIFSEVRIPWFILFLLVLGTALKQYKELGFVLGEVCFLLMVHFSYTNTCTKGKDLIILTWDMCYKK